MPIENSFWGSCGIKVGKYYAGMVETIIDFPFICRPLIRYLSLCFKEARKIDGQKGKYEDGCWENIEAYNPDVVLILTEVEGEYRMLPIK